MNPNDRCRDLILRHLYERHSSARGVKAIPVGIRDFRRAMRREHGMSQADVASNLDYLIQAHRKGVCFAAHRQ